MESPGQSEALVSEEGEGCESTEEIDKGDRDDELLLKKQLNKGRKRKRFTQIPAKRSIAVENCCKQNCEDGFLGSKQKMFNRGFHDLKNKVKQDDVIMSCLNKKTEQRKTKDVKSQNRNCSREYHITHDDLNVTVCRKFFQVLNISEKRLRTVQSKIKAGNLDMSELRGSHKSRPRKINDNIHELAHKHLRKIPHRNSHYTKSNRKSFEDSSLTVRIIYERFKAFYLEKKRNRLRMTYSTYCEWFGEQSPYSITRPRTDTCDNCDKWRKLVNFKVLLDYPLRELKKIPEKLRLTAPVDIKPSKRRDLTSLMQYVPMEERQWYVDNCNIELPDNEEELSDSHSSNIEE
ncbi:hypothetical protein QAD02_005682 [Eretmocerus hayati]|uniref:Uncharacterized protein n=1 Tax=Eretmocerus hayati TaxID=131215 RepID=A0ACC2NT82_9HYME|nr:hypothetical protein QAD02_005682 [Eretmocerus hayati]